MANTETLQAKSLRIFLDSVNEAQRNGAENVVSLKDLSLAQLNALFAQLPAYLQERYWAEQQVYSSSATPNATYDSPPDMGRMEGGVRR